MTKLLELPLFADLPQEAVEELAGYFQRQTVGANELLFKEGDPGDRLYLIESGEMKISITNPQGEEVVLNHCGAGDSLGQITLIDQEPRTATVTAVKETELLMLTREKFLSVVTKLPDRTLDNLRTIAARMRLGYADLLRKLPLFAGLPPESLRELAKNLERETIAADEALFRIGDPGSALYIVNRGRVKITLPGADGDELVLNQCGAGEALGEMSLLDDAPRSASVIALEPTELLKLDRKTFIDVLHQHPDVSMDMMRILSSRMRFNLTYIEEVIDLSKRIAEGDYRSAMERLSESQDAVHTGDESDRAKAQELISAFFKMVEGVKEREEELKQKVHQLTIQIDQAKRKEEFEKLTSTDFFADLKETSKRMREEANED